MCCAQCVGWRVAGGGLDLFTGPLHAGLLLQAGPWRAAVSHQCHFLALKPSQVQATQGTHCPSWTPPLSPCGASPPPLYPSHVFIHVENKHKYKCHPVYSPAWSQAQARNPQHQRFPSLNPWHKCKLPPLSHLCICHHAVPFFCCVSPSSLALATIPPHLPLCCCFLWHNHACFCWQTQGPGGRLNHCSTVCVLMRIFNVWRICRYSIFVG